MILFGQQGNEGATAPLQRSHVVHRRPLTFKTCQQHDTQSIYGHRVSVCVETTCRQAAGRQNDHVHQLFSCSLYHQQRSCFLSPDFLPRDTLAGDGRRRLSHAAAVRLFLLATFSLLGMLTVSRL